LYECQDQASNFSDLQVISGLVYSLRETIILLIKGERTTHQQLFDGFILARDTTAPLAELRPVEVDFRSYGYHILRFRLVVFD
jgi:hypothetical protein